MNKLNLIKIPCPLKLDIKFFVLKTIFESGSLVILTNVNHTQLSFIESKDAAI